MSSLRFPLATAVLRSIDEDVYSVAHARRVPIHAIWAFDEDERRAVEARIPRALVWDGVFASK